jgi:hypothetical protein
MHQADSERKIEIMIDGERVCGTVHIGGATELSVRLDEPAIDWTTGVHMPYFARTVHPEGFLGQYGEESALAFLVSLYKEQKQDDRRRKFAGFDFQAFGRVRYLAVSPRHPAQERKIREQAKISSTIYVQIEDDGLYGLARFFDSGTKQPFLAESAVYEESVQAYVAGVMADLGFRQYMKTVRRKLLPDMVQIAADLEKFKLNPRQVDFLKEFGQFWRIGVLPLDAADVDHLSALGYLVRDPGRCAIERATLEASVERSRRAMERFEAAGKRDQAAQCLARMRKLQERIEVKTLMITRAGKAAAEGFPGIRERLFRP